MINKIRDDNSFVTVLINAHGRELRDERATPEQKQTLRRLSMAGKSGMLSGQGIPNMMPTIFYHAHELSIIKHLPFLLTFSYAACITLQFLNYNRT